MCVVDEKYFVSKVDADGLNSIDDECFKINPLFAKEPLYQAFIVLVTFNSISFDD